MTLINVVSQSSVPELTIQSSPIDDLTSVVSQWDALSSRSASYAFPATSPAALRSIESARTTLCEWAYLLVDHYSIERSIVSIAFSMFDRYITARGQDDMELLALSCMYLAIKVHSTSGKMPVGMLARLARSSGGDKRFSVEEIESMEFRVLSSLGWLVNPTVPSMFLDVAFDALVESSSACRLDAVRDLSIFLVEISIIDVYFVNVAPSSVAAGALLLAMHEIVAPSSNSTPDILENLQFDRLEASQCAHRLSQHYSNWKNEEMKKKRVQSASPTGVGMIQGSISEKGEEEGSSLHQDFEEEAEETCGGGKRKRSC